MPQLNNKDYITILKYYKKEIPSSSGLVKANAKHILATKLCRCIKKIDKQNEARAIGICTKTIINRKGFTRGKFSCKGKTSISLNKNIKNKKSKKNVTRKNKLF